MQAVEAGCVGHSRRAIVLPVAVTILNIIVILLTPSTLHRVLPMHVGKDENIVIVSDVAHMELLSDYVRMHHVIITNVRWMCGSDGRNEKRHDVG